MNGWKLLLILASISASVNAMQQDICIQPQLIKPIEDWDIIASNKAVIKISSYFKGSELTYSLTHNNINAANKVSINEKTGEIKIVAESRDNFDIKVNATNSCGEVNSTFNVQIDQEDDD
ncbi:cadherin repeat domain-containing protein [uncultured Legionella sp.]|uniref:cadherin repeat domain-containing protein n=1 Tax=uncultured Legionella sp. TaxID=210934 RepID=UPI002624AE03|nr:cadherin repeat domain-containing protein [uncultured Legionella sp.]